MSDLQQLLPDFNVKPFYRLLHSLEKNEFTVADLISVDPVDIARKCPLPLLDVRHLVAAVIEHMQKDLSMLLVKRSTSSELLASTSETKSNGQLSPAKNQAMFIQTLDSEIDALLGGGFPCGYVTEIVGESAVGKTQFLLGLLLSAQLPPPYGVEKAAIYLSTEDPLNTRRLAQMLHSHPFYAQLPPNEQPSFDHVHTMTLNTLDQQQHIAEYKLHLAIDKFNAGLVIIDSVAANFRADRESTTMSGLVDRAADLTKLGSILRKLATEKQVAIVVANQVSDRFAESLVIPAQDHMRSSSPASSTVGPSQLSGRHSERDMKMSLDHQSRFFTGWGDKPASMIHDLKSPALGLAWVNQLDARIVLKVESQVASSSACDGKRRRFMNVVFAPWTGQKIKPVEYSIETQGIVARAPDALANEHEELLDESLWSDDGGEFP